MSLYAETVYENQGDTLVVHIDPGGGAVYSCVYQLVAEFIDRTTCFCCSCVNPPSDPYCRNHGWAGTRPCDNHVMPGQPTEEGDMPETVEWARARYSPESAR